MRVMRFDTVSWGEHIVLVVVVSSMKHNVQLCLETLELLLAL